MLSQGNRATPL